jgi:hypothetical protein
MASKNPPPSKKPVQALPPLPTVRIEFHDPEELKARNVWLFRVVFVLVLIVAASWAGVYSLARVAISATRERAMVASTADLRLVPLKPIDRQVVSQARLEEFVRKAISTMQSMSFRSVDEAAANSRDFFCPQSYEDMLGKMQPLYERVTKDKLVSSWVFQKGPVVTSSVENSDGTYTYRIDGEGLSRYEGKSEETHQYAFIFEVIQTLALDHPYGVCVRRFNFRPK